MDKNLEAALLYAQKYGFAVFPIHGIKQRGEALACTCHNILCENPGKHPAVSNGLKAASKDPRVIENLWAAREGLNIGVATGAISGVFAVDIDGIVGQETMNSLPELPDTFTNITSRGKHLIFKYPNKKVFSRQNIPGQKVDIRGDGGYIVFAPSRHISGVEYSLKDPEAQILDAPQWLLDRVCADAKAPVVSGESVTNKQHNQWSLTDVLEMLSFLSADCDHETWVNIGMALESGGYSFSTWNDWSKTAPHRYNPTITEKKWRSFDRSGGITMGTLVDKAMLAGWKPRSFITDEPISIEDHPARDFLKKINGIKKPAAPLEEVAPNYGDVTLGFNPLGLDSTNYGLIGDTVRWISETAMFPQPELALINTLTALSAIFSRRYASPKDTRTNIFSIGLVGTAKGKDHSRKCIKRLMDATGHGQYLGGDTVRSAAGIFTTLSQKISCIMMIDEFGLFMGHVFGAMPGQHKSEIGDTIMQLFSSSNSVLSPGQYADPKAQKMVLHQPGLCIYGTSTLSSYADAMKKSAISSGAINRYLTIQGRKNVDIRLEDVDRNIPDYIVDAWKELSNWRGDMANLNNNIVVEDVIRVTGDCWAKSFERILRFQQSMIDKDGYTSDLWGRYAENTIKIAMIFAICRNPKFPQFIESDFKYAENIAKSSVEFMIGLATEFMYENEHEKNKKDVLRQIRTKNGGIARTDLLKTNYKIKSRDLDEIIKGLIEEEIIEANREYTGGKPRIIYKRT